MASGRFVESRRHYFTLDRTLHLRNFFRTLVNEQHNQIDVREIRCNGMRDVLKHDRLAAFRAGDQQAALAFADRRDDVDDAPCKVFFRLDVPLHLELLGRKQRGQVLEQYLVLGILGRFPVYLVYLYQREIALTVFGRPDLSFYRIACMKIESAYL